MNLDEYSVEDLQDHYNRIVEEMNRRAIEIQDIRKTILVLKEQRDVLHDAIYLKKSPAAARALEAATKVVTAEGV